MTQMHSMCEHGSGKFVNRRYSTWPRRTVFLPGCLVWQLAYIIKEMSAAASPQRKQNIPPQSPPNTVSHEAIYDHCAFCLASIAYAAEDSAGAIVNDYPYNNCSGVDKWGYYKCQCTSFAAWRINDRLKIKFDSQYKGTNWSNGNSWDDAARKTSVAINSTPKPGAIAQSNTGHFGHVAWVTKVSESSVTVEEYNWVRKEGYRTRRVPKSTFNYIHLK